MRLHTLAIAATLAALIACTPTENSSGTAPTNTPAQDTTRTEAYITQRINQIYDFIKADSTLSIPITEKDRKFMSAAFIELQDSALEIARQTNDNIIDADHWICGQDWTRPTVEILSITDITDSTATAQVRVTNNIDPNNPQRTNLILPLVWERDNWFVDDFVQTWMSQRMSEREWLQKYVDNNRRKK